VKRWHGTHIQSYDLHQQHMLEHKHAGPHTGQMRFIDSVTERIMTKGIKETKHRMTKFDNFNYYCPFLLL
jgi:hypothetical protein